MRPSSIPHVQKYGSGLLVDPFQKLDVLPEVADAQILFPHSLAGVLPKSFSVVPVLQKPAEGRCERVDVRRVVEEEAAGSVGYLILDAAHGAGDDGPGLPHRLSDREAKALLQALLNHDRCVPLQRVDDRGILVDVRHGKGGEMHPVSV